MTKNQEIVQSWFDLIAEGKAQQAFGLFSDDIVYDLKGTTLAAASSLDKSLRKTLKSTSSIAAAKAVGALLAERAKSAKIQQVVFDRGGRLYHGRIKALADASREGGLQF